MVAGDRGDRGALIAARLGREHFGLDGAATPLPGELDRNFALDGHVLKLHAPGTAARLLDLQDAALEHLAGRCDAVDVPRLRRTREGAPRVASAEGIVRVLSWVAGTPWAAVEEPGAMALESLGRAVAHVDRALKSFDHAGARPAAALEHAERERPAGRRAGRGRRARCWSGSPPHVAPRLHALPTQAIHNDANEHNVLVDADGRVRGLIDFGDVCRAPRVCGLAVAVRVRDAGARGARRARCCRWCAAITRSRRSARTSSRCCPT